MKQFFMVIHNIPKHLGHNSNSKGTIGVEQKFESRTGPKIRFGLASHICASLITKADLLKSDI